MTKKLGMGKPLEELVRGSLNYTLNLIMRAFRKQFETELEDDWSMYIEDVFADYVVVSSSKLPPSTYYQAPYAQDGETFTFAEKSQWTVVELTYTPRTLQERTLSADNSPRLVETGGEIHLLDEAAANNNPDGPWPIRAIGTTAGVVNANRRRYPRDVLASAVAEAKRHLHESMGQGRIRQLYGESEHPSMKASRRPFLSEVVVNWTGISFDGRHILIEGNLLGTQLGKDIRAQMLGGVIPGISQRGYGESEEIEVDGQTVEEVTRLVITGYDLTVEPSDAVAGVTYFESVEPKSQERNKEETMTAANENTDEAFDLATWQMQHPDLVERIVQQRHAEQAAKEEAERRKKEAEEAERRRVIDEANANLRKQLGLSETDDLEAVLQEREQRRLALEREQQLAQVKQFVESEIAGIVGYPDWVKEQIKAEVLAGNPATRDEATGLIKQRRAFADQMLAQVKRRAMGDAMAMKVLGPVIEGVTGQPAYAEPAILLVESVVRHGLAPDYSAPEKTPVNEINMRFAREYLAAYDRAYKHHLVQEARTFAEAEQTSDLNLPYSVMRAVLAEAIPQLVATTVFDVQMTDQADVRIYYEDYTGESGELVAVTDEVVVSDEDDWVELDYKRITPGSWDLTDSGGTTHYVEGDDFAIDPANGLLWTVSAANGGTIGNGTSLKLDYTYRAIRKGEMAAIEQAKASLSYVLVSCEADRLATQISREAVVLSKAALGYDATARMIAMLVGRIKRYIDGSLLGLALSASLAEILNAGITWTSSTETVNDLVEKLGTAKVRVINRYYEPTAILMSATNAEIASNWDNFSAAGSRPDALLNANGFIGRLKGLPLVQSTEMRDAYDLVLNREIVHHRVLQPAALFGPQGSYSTTYVVPADYWWIEEFNAQVAPVKGKACHVKHA